jgi:hypothetical protein
MAFGKQKCVYGAPVGVITLRNACQWWCFILACAFCRTNRRVIVTCERTQFASLDIRCNLQKKKKKKGDLLLPLPYMPWMDDIATTGPGTVGWAVLP